MNDTTALFAAAYAGNRGEIAMLLKKGVDVDSRNEDGFTALHLTVGTERRRAVKALLKAGADINSR